MATVLSKLSEVYENLRKPIATTALVLKSSASQLVTAAPTLQAGSGVPSHAAPNGSGWLRTDATNGDDAFYVRVAGAWVPILGQTA